MNFRRETVLDVLADQAAYTGHVLSWGIETTVGVPLCYGLRSSLFQSTTQLLTQFGVRGGA